MSKSDHRAWRAAGRAIRLLSRTTKRFRRDRKGSTAVEFAFVVVPFLALLFAIFEAALAFFAGSLFDTAMRDAARLVRTGQAQTQGFNAAQFRDFMCQRMNGAMFDCARIVVDVRTSANLATENFGCARTAGNVSTNSQFIPGQGGDIVVARACYQWPALLNIMGTILQTNWQGSSIGREANGTILISSTIAFRNEPFRNP